LIYNTYSGEVFACVTKCRISALLTFNLSSKFHFTVAVFVVILGFYVCDEERRPVAEFMGESIVFCSMCTMSLLKSSRSLSHLLMSFLSFLLQRKHFMLLEVERWRGRRNDGTDWSAAALFTGQWSVVVRLQTRPEAWTSTTTNCYTSHNVSRRTTV